MGPPLWNHANADKFREKHLAEHQSRPFIEDGRYVMEVPREYQTAKSLLSSDALLECESGQTRPAIAGTGWTLHEGAECWKEEFAPFIAEFFDQCSPLTRIQRNGYDGKNKNRYPGNVSFVKVRPYIKVSGAVFKKKLFFGFFALPNFFNW